MNDQEPLAELSVRLPRQLVSYLRREARASGVGVDLYLTRVLQESYKQQMLELLRRARAEVDLPESNQ
jgi:hypothetical protein